MNRCHFVSFVMNIYGAKFEEHASTFLEILFIKYFTILVANVMMSPLS